jgi:flavin-dependent dehydrogenase
MITTHPIEIIGGGLAGLSLGLALRRENVPVRILEAGDYPRHRVCGEFIAGLREQTQNRLELTPFLEGAAPNREVRWYVRDRAARDQRLPDMAPGISRWTLDARLARAFVSAGGDLQTGHRFGDHRDVPGRIFATGRRRAKSRWLGLKIHAIDLPVARDLELHLGEEAYVGLARIEESRVNICGLFRRRALSATGCELLFKYLDAAGLTSLGDRLRAANLDSSSFSAVAAVDFDPRIPSTGDVRVGDALAMIPPFTGHGMAMAFQSAELALDPLIAFARGEISWPKAQSRIHAAQHRRFRLRLASASALHSFLHQPSRQRWLGALNQIRLLPLRPLYAVLH